jgi:hypothetical protein
VFPFRIDPQQARRPGDLMGPPPGDLQTQHFQVHGLRRASLIRRISESSSIFRS